MYCDPIYQDIKRFIKAHGMAPSRFGRLAVADPALFRELSLGRELRRAMRDRVQKFMRTYKNGPPKCP